MTAAAAAAALYGIPLVIQGAFAPYCQLCVLSHCNAGVTQLIRKEAGLVIPDSAPPVWSCLQ